MKKTIVIAIVAVLAVLGVGIIIKFSQNSTSTTDKNGVVNIADDSNNPAVKIEAPEIRVTEDSFEAEIKNYKGIAMLDFYLPTCPHCQKIGPIVTEVAKETEGKYKIGKIDANKNNNLATQFQIESVPALIFFKDGNEVARLIGAQTKEAILAKLEEAGK